MRPLHTLPLSILIALAMASPAAAQGLPDTGALTQPVAGTVDTVTGIVTGTTGTVLGVVDTVTGIVTDPNGALVGILDSKTGLVTPPGQGTGSTPGGSTPAAKDSTAPKIVLATRKAQKLRTVLRRGIPVGIGCSERCVFFAQLIADGPTARRLGLSRGTPVAIGTVYRTLPGLRLVRTGIKLTNRAKRALARAARSHRLRSVKLHLISIGADPSSNRSPLQDKVIRLKV